jgi:ApeA N-terminal domain 1
MQPFECQGLWTLPDTEAPPVAGTLHVSSSGELRLALIGSLAPSRGLQPGKDHPVILGSVDGPLDNEVTLTGCYLTRSKVGSFADVREEYRAHRGLFGAHLSKTSDFAFRRMQLQVGGFGPWAHSLSGFREGGQGGTRVGEGSPLLFYAMPAPVGGPILGGEISLGFRLTSSSTEQGYTFAEQPGVVVTCDPPLSEAEINQRFIYPLQNLMTFVCDRAQEVEQISLWREDILVPRSENPEIRLISARVFPETEDESAEPAHPHELLFTLADIEGGFAPFMERWLRLTSRYADACNIFFGLHYGPPAYLDITFLGVVESLCLYYTRREDGVAHRTQEERRLREVLDKLPPSDATWVLSHIWVRPFPPLQDLLAKLLGEHAEIMSPLLRTDQPGFVTEVLNTVNYVVRREPEVWLAASRGANLYWLMAKLRILLKLCFLRELEFSVEKMRSFFAKDRVYQHLYQLVSSQRAGPSH